MSTMIIVGNQHLASFNKPRSSHHQFIMGLRSAKPPTAKVWGRMIGYKGKNLWWSDRAHRNTPVHAFNVIVMTDNCWVVTYEDLLPRTFGKGGQYAKKAARNRLLRDNCKAIISLSEYAIRKFKIWNAEWSGLQRALDKTVVIPPNLPLRVKTAKQRNKRIRIVFVGRALARKGGVSVLRMARNAHEDGYQMDIHIVSSLQINGYTDHTDHARYDDDLALLDLPNVTLHKELVNEEVLKLLASADFQVMPTLGDTYGYSLLEGFSLGTPSIATRTCAIPEFIKDGRNGYLLDVPCDDILDISWLRRSGDLAFRSTDAYWELLDAVYSDLARQAYQKIVSTSDSDYVRLSQGAIDEIRKNHDVTLATNRIHDLYDRCLHS